MRSVGPPRYEHRAWAPEFPKLPQPQDEPWTEEIYILPLGLLGRNIKIRDGALEIKELVLERDGLQLWRPTARLEFPIPALTLERELMVLLQIGQPLRRERYGAEEIMTDIVEARRNVVAVPLRKQRRRFETAAGALAETVRVEAGGQTVMTAAAEHEEPERVLAAIEELGLDRFPNLDYPATLDRLRPIA